MGNATHASLVLARFDELRETGRVVKDGLDGLTFLEAGADVRAANTDVKSQLAFNFVGFGLHTSEDSARCVVQNWQAVFPWMAEAKETWSGVLQPFRHFGEANFGQCENPGPLFETGCPPPESGPVVGLTSVGWDAPAQDDYDRIKKFSDGVSAVRISMSGVDGLHSHQSFSFPGVFRHDGLTVTFWRDLAATMAFAYGPGLHRMQVKLQRDEHLGDRTSFTRFQVLESEGTWHGTDPLRF